MTLLFSGTCPAMIIHVRQVPRLLNLSNFDFTKPTKDEVICG